MIHLASTKYIWVHDEEVERYVTADELDKYLQYSWALGRIRDCCCHCGQEFNKMYCKNHEVRCKKKLTRRLKKLKYLQAIK
jgi:hypothetical protein